MDFAPIKTNRLEIRPLQSADWRSVYAYMSNPEVTRYLPDGSFTIDQAKEFVDKNTNKLEDALALTATGQSLLIGHMIFHPWFAPHTYEIGWVLHPQQQRQGYATEAAQALLRYAFHTLKAHRVIATCQPENRPSYLVMENIGMRREAFFQKCIYRGDNLWWDEYFYAILAEEWQMEQAIDKIAA